MRMNYLSLCAALALVAACSSTPEKKAEVATGGTATTTTTPPAAKPTGPVPGSKEDFVVNVGDRVFFGYDKFDLTPEATATLDKQAAWLKKYGQVTITIEGHADERGTREYNLALGERRANAVKNYLTATGVDLARVQVISYGKERPAVLGSNEAAWAQNRRGVTVIN
ncbi:peptidoglycan-associated lipoprotein Pal [Nitrospirillum amazonense]|uniref:Peptidoglycan-associated lipoprotein n=1 Tax=Nitrospirillum amazonense TaxID=28077 RepID=A0A560FZN4_9PROT|nr:peptidoglycan-associated lipoprotein Pal [Nitrospirillum amazonense]MDG3441973.1 peptidoglycan-associated lipoprotein Pal [Nitrospirillum amazonense]MEC4591093.1 peptidoglycan-associated lipoprotein Pal [Nitrospirillum amazonense]TWB27098.1 peptidoglycan-associated lipoprotein [Nitrospirillum amazonense]TWB73530.1 peptidoglycan-associated lipoprotein [Nitrospirillum amazonense]